MITAITTTHNRPELFALLERWVSRMSFKPTQWIVLNDSDPEYLAQYKYTCGQDVLIRNKQYRLHPLCAQWYFLLNEHLDKIKGDTIAVLEDDDFYHKDYLAGIGELMYPEDFDPLLVGFVNERYYSLPRREYRNVNNIQHAALASTGFKREILELVKFCAALGDEYIDFQLWKMQGPKMVLPVQREDGTAWHIGIKGLGGISPSHRESLDGTADPDFAQLRRWIGNDEEAAVYVELAERHARHDGE